MAAQALKRVLVLALAWTCADAHTDYLLQNARLCDESGRVCIRGWLLHDPHKNQIELDARLERAGQPGTITLLLDGITPGGHLVTTSLSVDVRGSYSEIIQVKIKPEWPFETCWQVRTLHFEQAAGRSP